MSKNLALMVASATLTLAASNLFAADVNLKFTGTISGETCTVNGSTSQFDKIVNLPNVSTSALVNPGDVAGETGFSLEFTGCTGSTVQAKFAAGSTVDMSNGNLNNAGTSNVQVQLLNASHQKIELNNNSGLSQTETLDISTGSGTMQFYAQYFAKQANTTAGSVNTNVLVDMLYN